MLAQNRRKRFNNFLCNKIKQIFEDLIKQTQAKGNLIPDAFHAALAIESGCQWVTTDKGFKIYKGLKTLYL